MITYSRLAAKVWKQVSHFGPVLARELRREEIENIDAEILRWYESVPGEIKISAWERDEQQVVASYDLKRLRIWTYLRLNQVGQLQDPTTRKCQLISSPRSEYGYIYLSFIVLLASWGAPHRQNGLLALRRTRYVISPISITPQTCIGSFRFFTTSF